MPYKKGSKTQHKFKKTPSKNKKVLNATPNAYNGINFRSKLETFTYKALNDSGLQSEYEKLKLTILDKFDFQDEKIRAVTWLPDFVVTSPKGVKYLFEIKGFSGAEKWVLKSKMIKDYIVRTKSEYKLVIATNQKEVLAAIEIIKKN